MAKIKPTEAAVIRAVRGAMKGGIDVEAVEIRHDGSILITAKGASAPVIDDPEELRKLL